MFASEIVEPPAAIPRRPRERKTRPRLKHIPTAIPVAKTVDNTPNENNPDKISTLVSFFDGISSVIK